MRAMRGVRAAIVTAGMGATLLVGSTSAGAADWEQMYFDGWGSSPEAAYSQAYNTAVDWNYPNCRQTQSHYSAPTYYVRLACS